MNKLKRALFGLLMLSAFCLLGTHEAGADAEKGWFGFAVKVDASGFSLNPTIQSLNISKVIPGSPAARQGIVSGDQVTEVEGLKVPGSKARDLQAVMQKKVGETLHLRLRRADGKDYSVALVGVVKPKS